MTTDAFTHSGDTLGLHCIGVQFRDVPNEVRDAVALSPTEVSEVLARITESLPGAEAVVLATCNRTELYVVEAGDPVRLDLWHRTVGHRLPGGPACPADLAERMHLTGHDAVAHLVRVACGLESAELGDGEIAGQVRRARQLAEDAGTVGPVLHRLFDVVATAAKQARTETTIGDGGAGIGSAVVSAIVGRVAAPRVVTVVGAGDAAGAVCRELRKRTSAELRIVNRTLDRADELAAQYGGAAHDLTDLPAAMAGACAVVTAVHGDRPVVDRRAVAVARTIDPSWSPVVVDTCVPAMVADLDGAPGVVAVVRRRDLADRRAEIVRRRRRAVPAVEAIAADATRRFDAWFRDRAMKDVVAALFREADQLTEQAAGLVDDDRAARAIQRAVRRLVHQHITRLRSLETAGGPTRRETQT